MRWGIHLSFILFLAWVSSAEFVYIDGIYVKDTAKWANLSAPSDVFPSGNYTYVLDTNNHRIVAFQNWEVKSVTSGGTGSAVSMLFPRAFYLAEDGRVYIANTGSNNVLVYEGGNYVYGLAIPGSDAYSFDRPSGIMIYDGKIYVSDTGRGYVSYFNLQDRTYLGKIGSKGFGDDQLTEAHGIYIKDGMLYVADKGNNRIQVFWLNGTHVAAIRGAYECSLNSPRAVSVDVEGTIFVSDTGNNRVVVFEKDGKCLEILDGNSTIRFSEPWGIRLDSSKNLYVADSGNHIIQIFRYIPYYQSEGKASEKIDQAEAAYSKLDRIFSAASHLGIPYSDTSKTALEKARYEFVKGNYSNAYFNATLSISEAASLNSSLSLKIQSEVLRMVLGDEEAVAAIENNAMRHGVSVDTGPLRTELAHIRSMLDAGKYVDAAFNATVLHSRIQAFNLSASDTTNENIKTRDQLLLAISDARNELSDVITYASQYKVQINSTDVSSIIDRAYESCSQYDFDKCRQYLSAARNKIEDVRMLVQAHNAKVEAVRQQITAAYLELSQTYSSAYFFKPDLGLAEKNLSQAEAIVSGDPEGASELVKNAVIFIEGSKPGIIRTNQLTLIGLGLVVFAFILLIGIYYLTKGRPGKKKESEV